MNEKKNNEHEYVKKALAKVMQETHAEVYGAWRQKYAPDTYAKEIEKLLPEKYMAGMPCRHPNKLYTALLKNDTETAKKIITASQYMTICQVAKKAEMETKTTDNRIQMMLKIAEYEKTVEKVPKIIADDITDWIKHDINNIGTKRIGNYAMCSEKNI